MYMKSRLRISTRALKHLFCIEHNALMLLLSAFHHLKDSRNPRVCWELLDRSCRGRRQWGGSLAALPCSAQQGRPLRPRPSPGVTDAAFTALPRSSLHQRSRRTQTPAQGEGTNLLQSPTHSSAAGQQLCKGNVSMPFSLESRVNPFNPPN